MRKHQQRRELLHEMWRLRKRWRNLGLHIHNAKRVKRKRANCSLMSLKLIRSCQNIYWSSLSRRMEINMV
jgi:hypothetical protein